MMEDIHLDTSDLVVAPTAFYSNKMLSAALSPPLAPPRPPGKSNGSGPGNGNGSNDGRGPPPWPTYVNPSQEHIVMYPDPSPTDQQRPQAFMATTGPYTLPGFVPEQQPLYQQAPPTPPLGWAPWNDVGWEQQSLTNSFSTMAP
jgi:hypothetical protein